MIIVVETLESLRNTTRLLMTSQRNLETGAIFRFAPMLSKGCCDRARFYTSLARRQEARRVA